MVALDFPQTEQGLAEDALLQRDIPVRIEVFFINDDGLLTPVPIEDNRAILRPPCKTDGVKKIAYLHLYGTDGVTSNAVLVRFHPSEPGHYFTTVTTVVDQPAFFGIRTMLKVTPFYNAGK